MTQDAADLLKRALDLSAKERAELADSLLESLDAPPEDAEAVEAAWNQEIARRIEDLDSGKAKTVPWEEVRQRLSSKRQATDLLLSSALERIGHYARDLTMVADHGIRGRKD